MSPPSRTRADSRLDQAPDSLSRAVEKPAPEAGANVGSAEGGILATQHAAGNRAVASMLGGGRGVQRAPIDDEDGGSGATSYAAPSLAAPPRSGATSVAAPSIAPPGTGAPRAERSPAAPATPADGPGSGPAIAPLAVPAGMFGGVNPDEKRQRLAPPRVVFMQSEVETAFQLKKDNVLRSPNENWHFNAWYHSNNGKVDEDKPTPQIFKVGSRYYVAPDYGGPATELPVIAAVGGAGTTAPAPGGGGTTPGGPAALGVPDAHGPPPDKMRQAVAPFTPFTGEPRGSQKAKPVMHSEVTAALAADPTKVVRSPNARWHRQGYRLDGGGREAPGAFKVGDLYVIAPDYPMEGVPKLGESAPPKPSGLPQAVQTVAPGGTTYTEGSALRSYTSTTTESGGRSETRTRSRQQALVTTTTETSEGGITNKQEKQRGAGFGVGGNFIGATAGTTETTKIEGDVVAAKKSTQVNAGLGRDIKLGAEARSTREFVTGTDPQGNPVKTSTSTKVGGKADFSGWEVGGGKERTDAKGTTTGAGAKLKGDWKGNVEVEGHLNLQTKGGLSFKPTVSHGVKVEASEPVEVEGGWEVTYRIAETSGVGLGGGKQLGGGGSVGVNVGATEADFQGGKRLFETEDDAKKFRDNAAERVASERMFAPVLAPTTVAGALQIPMGETRTSGDISGKSIGGTAGYSGVAINVGKSKSTTKEFAIKRSGPTVVEVTGSVTGSKSGSVGISAPVISHGYSSTNTTSFAVTFEFDLSKEQGRAAFELFCKTGWPPSQRPKLIERAGSDSDHDTVTIPGLGSAVWTGTTWQVSREAEDGSTSKVYGGAQIHEQKPGTLGKLIGEDTLKSNAQIVRVMKDGEEVGARAQMTVGGTSGEYNRAEFGKIFPGAKAEANVKPSGEWTLSAPVPKENIEELHGVSRRIRNAMDERQAYSELVKEGGAQMLGGQVGMTSRNWDLELKGDPNFPGEKERARLKALRKSLMARIRSNPEMAKDIVRETGEELAKLAKRREAVADLKRYTDLPDGLRQQQLGVIDMHIDDMKVVRRTGQAVAMKRNPGEKAADVAARVDREDKAGPGRRPKQSAAEEASAKADREYTKLQDQVSAKESRIAAKRKEIREFSKALGDAIGAKGTTAVKFGADSAVVQVAIAGGKGYIGAATDADKKQAALDPQVEKLRDAWSAATERDDQLAAIKALERVLDERLKLMESCLFFIREAGKAVFHITTKSAKSGNPAFWNSLGETEGEE